MTIKVLIVDPDIAFVLPVKRALEQSGDYAVSVFTTGRSALELVERDPQDVAILDFNISDISLPALIKTLRQLEPGLFILTSPRTADEAARVPTLDSQGSITKPYLARQLAPVIREAIVARNRLAQRDAERRLESGEAVESGGKPEEKFRQVLAVMYSSLAERNRLEQTQPGSAIQASALEEPELPEGATIRELVTGQTKGATTTPAPATMPEPIPDHLNDTQPGPDFALDASQQVASIALSAAEDETVPLEYLTPPAFIARIEQELGVTWVPQTPETADQPTLRAPTMPQDKLPPVDPLPVETQPVGGLVQEELEREQNDPEFQAESVPQAEPVPQSTSELPSEEPQSEPSQPALESLSEAPHPESPQPVLELPSEQPPLEPSQRELVAPPDSVLPESPSEPIAPASEELPDYPAFSKPAIGMALQLTQLTVNSAAQATVVTRGGALIASAGSLDSLALAGIVETIHTAWQSPGEQSSSLVRFITVPGLGDYLMYSTLVADGLILTMLFPADTPLRTIRLQAKVLIGALENVPEPPPEPEAAITQLNRPTDLRPPESLRSAIAGSLGESTRPLEPVTAEEAAPQPPATPPASGPYAGYAFVWLPRGDNLQPDWAAVLVDWLHTAADAHGWKLDSAEVQTSYVTIQVSIPANETPTVAVETLMRDTAARAEDTSLWADAYYIVTPGRAVTQQEIANFMEYRRSADDAA